jgi:acetylornithine deacetylase/succinyl-diaminopimelate desuccinylase-like protein
MIRRADHRQLVPGLLGAPCGDFEHAIERRMILLGNVGDGNIIQEVLGIPTVQYGPGDIRVYKEWPTPDERVRLTDLVTAAKAVAHATVRLCS